MLVFCGSLVSLHGQNYGNEWIKPNQKYFKVKVAREGIYRLDFATLSTAMFQNGVDISTINPRKFQVFHNGNEIPIYLHGESDGIFNFEDFIEFYGFPNTGILDRELYFENPTADPLHDFTSMFTDTSAYFITFLPNNVSQNGLRYQLLRQGGASSGNQASFFWSNSRVIYSNTYYAGHPLAISGAAFFLPEYTEGEGWVGSRFGFGPSMQPAVTATLSSVGFFDNGPQARVMFKLVSSTLNNAFNPDHLFKLSVSKDNISFQSMYDTALNGYGIIHSSVNIPPALLSGSNTIQVRMEALNIPGLALQGYHPSYVEYRYPRRFTMAGATQLMGEMPPHNQSVDVLWSDYGIPGDNHPLVYDLTARRRITPAFGAGQTFRYTLPSTANNHQFVIADSASAQFITTIEPVVFPAYADAVNNTQFLIITAQKWLGKETNDYLNYRKTSFAASLFTVESLYDAFGYGQAHPIAIRRFLRYLIDQSSTMKPEYVFFLGRGVQPNLLKNVNLSRLNDVPALGTPASDVLFSAGLGGKARQVPYLATGRLNVDAKTHIGIYLQKIIEQEQSPNAHWKKQIMHLGGGKDGRESNIIKGVLESFESLSKRPPFGGIVHGFYRSGSDPISELNLRNRAVGLKNEGVSLITFLGHGSSSVLDIDIGDTMDYQNLARYPIMYFNGCRVGNPAIGFNNGNLFFGERMVRAAGKGAIVFIGQSEITELYTVAGQMRAFYESMFQDKVGQSIGKVWQHTIEKNLNPNNFLSRYHNTNLILQGDPSFSLYNPPLPDYFVEPNALFLSPENANALSDSFRLGIIVGNMGRYVPSDSFRIQVRRSWPNDAKVEEFTFMSQAIAFKDTLFFTFRSKDIATTGLNKFEVHLNDDRRVAESDYGNNRTFVERFIEGNGVSLLYPRPFAIVTRTDTVTLMAQSLNLLRENNQFIFEVDTTPRFNSPWLKRTQPAITTGNIARWNIGLMQQDSQVYYWRARLNLPTNQGGFWETRSFIYINSGSHGWSQSHHPQFYPSSQLSQIRMDTVKRLFEFERTERYVWVDTRVNSHSALGVKFGGFASQDVNPGAGGSFVAVLLDRNTLRQFLHPKHYPKCWRGALWPPFQSQEENAYYCFSTNESNVDDFAALIDDIPEGTYVALFTRYDSRISEWSPKLKNTLKRLGGSLFEQWDRNQTSYVLIGQKGAEPGSMFEDISHISDPSTGGYSQVEGRILGNLDRGRLSSEPIGPSAGWGTFYFDWRPTGEVPNQDNITYTVYGIDTSRNRVLLFDQITQSPFNISSINPVRFPFIQVEGHFSDPLDRSAPQIKHWLVTFNEVPEATINTGNRFVFHNDTLQEGEPFRLGIAFDNISTLPMDSIYYQYELVDLQTQGVLKKSLGFLPSLPAGEAVFLRDTFNTRGLSGRFSANVSFNHLMQQPEVSLSNNVLNLPFMVVNDHLNPLLDVTFDGRHIMNADIVSPNPVILITSKDENPFLLQTDSNHIQLMLRKPGQQQFDKIAVNSPEIVFKPAANKENVAVLEYRPQFPEDGLYSLKVQSSDMSGNQAGRDAYSIDFQVINESTITHFYPYPNPFTSQCRFVFTLTGKDIPDDVSIKIMTISGRVVREIFKEELGLIRIGHNISDFAWDGTDQFGDRLANGVYLYQVQVKNKGDSVKQRETAGDNAFKKNVGKIYLLR